ncbi:ALA-interacting subunit 3-like protein [Tanacetum coccineum]
MSFITIAILFTPAGLLCLWASERVVEIVDRYDDDCLPDSYITNPDLFIESRHTNKTCVRTLKVPRKMSAPIFIYYQLDNFYQNHRRYVKSRSDKQLRDPDAADETDDCKPEDNLNGNDDEPIIPCGLVAWSLFNDTYKFTRGNKNIDVDKKDIAWKSDTKIKFGSNVYPKNFQKGDLIGGGKLDESKPLSDQEDLIVWMRTAALPTFRKLYGRINTDLEANETITVVIQNNYNTYEFGGEKKLILSTASWIGGKNDFFGISFLTIGEKKLHWVSWSRVMASCPKEGLGVESLFSLDRAMLFKWFWRFFYNPNALWVSVIRALHSRSGRLCDLSTVGAHYGSWKGIIAAFRQLKDRGVGLQRGHVLGGSLFSRRDPRGGVETKQWKAIYALIQAFVISREQDRLS